MRKLLLSMLALTLVVGCGNMEKKKDSNPSHECHEMDKKKDSNPSHHGHDYVDLGLSVKWATCNVGANSPEDYGEYYAWGEVSTKIRYTKENCATWKRKIDNIKGTHRDVAHVNWGGSWRMPTQEEFVELCEKCNWEWTGSGYEVTGPNGNSIYLPAAGYRDGETLYGGGLDGDYWSSTLYLENTQCACARYFDRDGQCAYWCYRYYGLTVRPVLE